MSDRPDVQVTHNPEEHRYEARIDGALAGVAVYERTDDLVVLTHTEVDDAHEGQGVGGALARFALEDIRAEGTKVVPECPFMKGWIDKHPEFQDVVHDAPAPTAD